jgi:hypothetical protein
VIARDRVIWKSNTYHGVTENGGEKIGKHLTAKDAKERKGRSGDLVIAVIG